MTAKIIILGLIFLINFYSAYSQILACGYTIDNFDDYICDLLLYNPTGSYNFSRISGKHELEKTNEDVQYIYRTEYSNSTYIPSIICDTFKNTIHFRVDSTGIEFIDENTFKNCKDIQSLDLSRNKIAKIDEKAFSENRELRVLYLQYNRLTTLPQNIFANPPYLYYVDLRYNQIEDLPKNIFRSLTHLNSILLESNKLKVIHAFVFSSSLTYANFKDNQIEAFDQNFIDDTGVQLLDMTNNLCANVSINDTSLSRLQMRILMIKCFDNYFNLESEFPTTLDTPTTTELTFPPMQCNDGNLDERVCRLEGNFQENVYKQDKINNDFHQIIADMQDKINELANYPCACQ